MNDTISRVCECDICGAEEITRRAVLPDGWMITWEHSCMICDRCVQKWADRWGNPPVHWIKGGEKELTLL